MKRTVNITVDFYKKTYNTMFLKQMDTTEIKATIIKNNIIADLTGQTIDIIFTKPDNTIVQQLADSIDTASGTATIQLMADCVRQHGKAAMEIEVKNTNSEVITSFYIPVQIEKTSKENASSSNSPNFYEEFMLAIDNFTQETQETINNFEQNAQEIIDTKVKQFNEMLENVNVQVVEENTRKIQENSDAIKKLQTITRKTITLEKHINWDEDWEIPISYTVGTNELEVRYEGCPCILGEHYREVGEPGTSSTKIQLVEDMTGDIGEIWEFVKRG